MTAEVSAAHRKTLEEIFGHPSSANIEWRRVRSLLEALGAATEERNGKLRITLGAETEVLQLKRSHRWRKRDSLRPRWMAVPTAFAQRFGADAVNGTPSELTSSVRHRL